MKLYQTETEIGNFTGKRHIQIENNLRSAV